MTDDKMMLRDICQHELCTGCMACVNVCGHSSIQITEDELGFRYPKINTATCTDCGLCSTVCPVNNPTSKSFPSDCYAFALRSPRELEKSSSGGAATAIGAHIISNGGVVYGCSGEDIHHVEHIRVDSLPDLASLRGSKYVQSDCRGVYKPLRADLLAGKQVVFIGVPCQVAGLRNFLRKDYENLLTVDLVCHGVPSQRLLDDNIARCKAKDPGMIENSVRFRRKRDFMSLSGEIEFIWSYTTSNNKVVRRDWYDDPYMFGFIEGLFYRSCCYECPYAYSIRTSDITLSDFWGLPAQAGYNTGRGVSSILVNTPRGRKFMEEFIGSSESTAEIKPRKARESISWNGQLMHPSFKSTAVDRFRSLYPEIGLSKSVDALLGTRKKRLIIKSLLQRIKKLL